MKSITSKDNPVYKGALKLLHKKYRDREGRYLIEGVKPLADALDSETEIETVFVREGTEAGAVSGDEQNVCLLAGDLFDRLSGTETSQGVIAVAKKKTGAVPEGRFLVLDRLQYPGNIGTIIRTAEAAGFGAVIAVKGTGDIYSPKVVRAAAGSLFRMAVAEGLETGEVKDLCRDRGLKLAVTALEGAADCYSADLTEAAIVIGNEGQGVSEEFLSAADIKVKIPMQGEIESLNAAVAAAVLMYESTRQQTAAGKVK